MIVQDRETIKMAKGSETPEMTPLERWHDLAKKENKACKKTWDLQEPSAVQARRKKVMSMYRSGMKTFEIATELDCSEDTIRSDRRIMGRVG